MLGYDCSLHQDKKNMAFQVGKTKALQAEELLVMVDIITDLNEDSVDEALVLRTFEVDRDFTRRSIVQGGDVQEENEKSHMNTQYQYYLLHCHLQR